MIDCDQKNLVLERKKIGLNDATPFNLWLQMSDGLHFLRGVRNTPLKWVKSRRGRLRFGNSPRGGTEKSWFRYGCFFDLLFFSAMAKAFSPMVK